MPTTYLEWCDKVWSTVGEQYNADKRKARYGMSIGGLVDRAGFVNASSQPGFMESPLFGAVTDALVDLEFMSLLDGVDQWRYRVSDLGRKGLGTSLRTAWRSIHQQVQLDDDGEAFLRKSVELGEVEGDQFARHRWLEASDVFVALGWDWNIGHAYAVTDDWKIAGAIVAHPTLGAVSLHNTYLGLVKVTTPATSRFVRSDPNPGRPAVMVGCAHEDQDIARIVATGLQDDGRFNVWVDEGELLAGESIVDRISEAAFHTDFLVAVVSNHSVESGWCQRELAIVMTRELNGRQVRVIPLRVDDVEMPPTLVGKRYLRVDPARPGHVTGDLVHDISALWERRG